MDAAFADYELKKEQTEAIFYVLSGSDVLVVLLTSFSKSMIYLALPWLFWTENFSNSPCNIFACCHNEESSGADEKERDPCSLHW